MKHYYFLLAFSLAYTAINAQHTNSNPLTQGSKKRIGVKAGLNFLSLNTGSFEGNMDNSTGFVLGGYYAVPAKHIGYRSEIIFSRQGYDYRTAQQTGSVKFDYIMLPQLMTLNITRFFQLHAGAQMAFLLNAKVDSSANPSSVPTLAKAKDYFSKINYGFAGGLELRPFAGALIGGRYNLFFNLLEEENPSTYPPYIPRHNGSLKNGVWQIYLGYQF